jgi:hypothetical protein
MAACMNKVLGIRSTQRNFATDFRSHKTPNPKRCEEKKKKKKKIGYTYSGPKHFQQDPLPCLPTCSDSPELDS